MATTSPAVELAHVAVPLPPPLSPAATQTETTTATATATAEQHGINLPQHIFIAVRKGAGNSVQNCIFHHWDDAKHHLEGTDSEYSVFETITDAVKYAFKIDISLPSLPAGVGAGIGAGVGVNVNVNGSHMNSVNIHVRDNHDAILAESMAADAESLMEQILPSPSTGNLLRLPNHDDFISLAHDAAAAMHRDDNNRIELPEDVPHGHAEDGAGIHNQQQQQGTGTDSNIGIHNSQSCTSTVNNPQEESRSRNISQNTAKATKRGLKRRRVDERTRARETKKEADWSAKYNLLVNYIAEHGTCNVPIKPENNVLTQWINAQKSEYRKLQGTGASKLTASQVQKLNDIGLKFPAKRTYVSWEKRMEQLRVYKQVNGHALVPVNDPTLGSWVHSQRREYKKYMNNDPKTKMTQERLQQMVDVGFVFEVAKKSQPYDARSNARSWDERFEELVDFKETFGHTLVPQHYPNLGWWVNTQRKEHKKLKAGKKTSLSIERCLKLTEIGFVFDASNKRGSSNYDEPRTTL